MEPSQERSQFVGYKCGFHFRTTFGCIVSPESRDSLGRDPQAGSEIREPELLQTLNHAGAASHPSAGVNCAVAVAVGRVGADEGMVSRPS